MGFTNGATKATWRIKFGAVSANYFVNPTNETGAGTRLRYLWMELWGGGAAAGVCAAESTIVFA
ncbi:hypothetical protein GCM10007047_29910 [Cerasicoccus arenae]|uniref:Uncharacterized protein n=1 Tax=Cerasicoccus arenae TaxID=424488 RepID=A0A8J3DJJ5_9BACT|nr:hypothetical protein GCM10007047_29910 [Cerasicoccus arenae]